MLFLAVLFGALAENYRENYIERNKEHEYLSSLIYDLREDTSRLNTCIESRIEKNTNAKKLISLLSQPVISNTKDIYYLTRLMTRVEAFEGVDGTFNQLRSGGFSLIEDKKIIGIMTSRPIHIAINNNDKDAKFDAYYVDYLCVDKMFRKKGIAPQIIQTHEYNQRHLNKNIVVSLFRI
jgi:ribosomal protein S18 acetylase RimI-like enzyme